MLGYAFASTGSLTNRGTAEVHEEPRPGDAVVLNGLRGSFALGVSAGATQHHGCYGAF